MYLVDFVILVSHVVPVNPTGQVQVNVEALPSVHSPPLTQGSDEQAINDNKHSTRVHIYNIIVKLSSLPRKVSHVRPVKLAVHMQW